MIRKIVQIDEARCIGCGLCAQACREAAIVMEGGKARLVRDDYCDGLGNCLPACPVDAITITEREAADFDEVAVKINLALQSRRPAAQTGCSGARPQTINAVEAPGASMLRTWPVQLRLVSLDAPYFDGAHLLVAADCTAYAYGSFHQDFMRGRVCLIGCPKLDDTDYAERLTAILARHAVQSVTLVRMEVPCCGGLERAARQAFAASGSKAALQVVTLSSDGRIIS